MNGNERIRRTEVTPPRAELYEDEVEVAVVGAVPTKGRLDTARFALGAILVYQLALLHRYYEQGSNTNRGLKAFLRAA
jgi:hypothetical protein